MKFLWPGALAALALIPLLLVLYYWRQRRRRRYAVRFSSLSLVRAALPAQSRLRRYLPMALFLVALASLAVALARPVAVTRVPAGRATVMLVLDVSLSMAQNDIEPSRIVAAQEAALDFVNKQKDTNQVGIVAFAGFAQLVQAPTTDPNKLRDAIRNLTLGRRTAIGDGIIAALDSISENDHNAQPTAVAPQAPGAAGQYRPDIIVLLTDGAANAGVDPLEAAQQAANDGIRVYTIGYGTEAGGTNLFFGGQQGRQGGSRRNFQLNERALKEIASLTGGEYYAAASAGQLQQVFDRLPTSLITREETSEISVAFAALAALVVTAAVLLSQLWHPLP